MTDRPAHMTAIEQPLLWLSCPTVPMGVEHCQTGTISCHRTNCCIDAATKVTAADRQIHVRPVRRIATG